MLRYRSSKLRWRRQTTTISYVHIAYYIVVMDVLRHRSVHTTISYVHIVYHIGMNYDIVYLYRSVYRIRYRAWHWVRYGFNKVHFSCISSTIKHCSLPLQWFQPHACAWEWLQHVSCCLQVVSCANLQSQILWSRGEMFARSATSRCWSRKDDFLFHYPVLNLQLLQWV